MKRATRSKFSGAELRDATKQGNLEGLKEHWATYLEGDVSEKYKEALGLLNIAIMQNDSKVFYWIASELDALEQKWQTLPNALKESKTTPARLRALDNAVHATCRQQQPAFLQRLLEVGFEANHPDKENDLPIHVACKKGNPEVLQLLLALPYIQVDKPDLDGDTPMTLAIQNKHPGLLDLLHARGADVNKSGKHGYTPLMVAIMQMDSEAITTLLRMAADIHLETVRGVTTLGVASGVNNIAMMQLMLGEPETNVNAVDENNATALMAACTFGHLEAAELLLDHGAHINAHTKVGSTAFWHACEVGNFPVVALLAKRGADVSKPNNAQVTPLMAAAMGGHVDVVHLLISLGVDINATEAVHHKTALHEASGHGCVEVVAALLHAGAKVDCCDLQWQSTPLQYASKQGYADVVHLLLQHGADVNKPNSDGMTPVMSAAEHNRVEALEVLLGWEGIRVDHVDQDGDTALLRACLHGYPTTVELLLKHGANMSMVNKKGKTAVILVREDAVKKRQNYVRCDQILQERLSGKLALATKVKVKAPASKAAENKAKESESKRAHCGMLPPLSHSKAPNHAQPNQQQQPQHQLHFKQQALLKQQAQQAQLKQRQQQQQQQPLKGARAEQAQTHSMGYPEQHYKMEPTGSLGPRNGQILHPSTDASTGAACTRTSSSGPLTASNGVQGGVAAQITPYMQPPLTGAHDVKQEKSKSGQDLVEVAARAAQQIVDQFGLHGDCGLQGRGVNGVAGEDGEGQQKGAHGRSQGLKRTASPDPDEQPGDHKRRKLARLLEVSEALNARNAELNFITAEQGRVEAAFTRLQASKVKLEERKGTTQAEVARLKADYEDLYAQVGLL